MFPSAEARNETHVAARGGQDAADKAFYDELYKKTSYSRAEFLQGYDINLA